MKLSFGRITVIFSGCISLFACIPKQQGASEVKQETDDRTTAASSKLVDVGHVLELFVNRGIDEARAELKVSTNEVSDETKLALIQKVGEKIGTYVKGSGVTIVDIVQLTNLEMAMDATLSAEKKEKVRVPFRCSRYRDNPVGHIPVVGGSTPANISEATANHTISSVFKFGDTLVGGDKLAHIFAVGRKLLLAKLSQEERWTLSQFLEGHPDFPRGQILKYVKMGFSIDPAWGVFGVYGAFSTGVISEADMYANEHGVRFYQNLFDAPASYRFDLKSLCEGEKPCAWYWNEQNVPNRFTRLINVNEAEGCRNLQ
jgi:hypothetical protein